MSGTAIKYFLAMSIVLTGGSLAFGQAGSIGGVVGKTDKSITSEVDAVPAAPARKPARPANPKQARENSHANLQPKGSGSCGPVRGSWLWYNGVTVTVTPNNRTTQSDGNSATVACADGTYTFTWFGFATTRMTLSSDGKRLSGTSAIGSTSAVRR